MLHWKDGTLLSALLLSSVVAAATTNVPHDADGPGGYIWYQNAIKPAAHATNKILAKPRLPSESEMMAMSPDELSNLHDTHLKHSLRTGDPGDAENVRRIQNVMLKKANAAANRFTRTSSSEPIANAGDPNTAHSLKEVRDEFALAIFTIKSCASCEMQKRALAQFSERWGWHIKEFDVNEHTKLVNRFDISSAPTILLIRRTPAQWAKISTGFRSLYAIEQSAAAIVSKMLDAESA